jgi:uncharacterized protein
LKVVFDTNIFVSALVFPGGRAEVALQRIIDEKDPLFISKPILNELLRILARKFARDAEELAHVAVFISELSTIVTPRHRSRVLKDGPDNRILECAVAAHADFVVSGDRALVKLREYRDVSILSLSDYLDK